MVENARRRLPGARFRHRERRHAGRAARSARSSTRSRRLDRDPEVDVIVIARGGGSVEDLLPFSNETLVRAVAAARTPVVSAIGHETDTPLLDLVADVAASTPTDAGEAHRPRPRRRAAATSPSCGPAPAARVHARLEREAELMAGLPRAAAAHRPGPARPRAAEDVAGCATAPGAGLGGLLEAAAPTSTTSGPASAPCRRRPPWTAATPWSARRPTAPWCATPADATGRLRVRVAGGEFGADAVEPVRVGRRHDA